MLMVFSVMGLCGGLLCCAGDILFDLKGAGNKKLGTSGNIDSNWEKMAYWRFGASILCALFGDAMVALGIYSLYVQLTEAGHPVLALVMWLCGVFGTIGGLFVHSLVCIQAVVYKAVREKADFETADFVLEKYYKQVVVPFFLSYIVLMAVPVCQMIAVFSGWLDVPRWFGLCNSIVFMLTGISLRKINPRTFQDLPGIIMPSLGLAMLGLTGVLNLV